MSAELLDAWVDVECPACGFSFEIQLMDAYCQIWRRCPCCLASVRLIEPDASLHGAMRDVDSSMRDLERALRGFGR